MWDAVVSWFGKQWTAMSDGWHAWAMSSLGGMFGPIGTCVGALFRSKTLRSVFTAGVVAGVAWLINSIKQGIADAKDMLLSVSSMGTGDSSMWTSMRTGMEFINAYVPVSEFLAWLPLLTGGAIAAWTLRSIKAWIPTLN